MANVYLCAVLMLGAAFAFTLNFRAWKAPMLHKVVSSFFFMMAILMAIAWGFGLVYMSMTLLDMGGIWNTVTIFILAGIATFIGWAFGMELRKLMGIKKLITVTS